jgi:hypothetical protein
MEGKKGHQGKRKRKAEEKKGKKNVVHLRVKKSL